MLYDEPIATETTDDGTPLAFTWRGARWPVREVLGVWRTPGGTRMFQVSVTTADQRPAVAEIAGNAAGWRVRDVWQ